MAEKEKKKLFQKKEIVIDTELQKKLMKALADAPLEQRLKVKEPLIGKLEKGTLTEEDINGILQYSNEWLNIKSIKNGVIETFDERYIKIVEIEPITFLMRAMDEQMDIIRDFYSWLKIAPIKLQFRIETARADATVVLNNFKKSIDKEENPEVKKRGEEESTGVCICRTEKQ